MEFLRGACLLLAVLTSGTVTGVYLLYSHTIMPGLGRTDDRTFIGAFQALDRAILNPLFLLTFLGPLVFTLIAAFTSLGTPLVPWLSIAAVLNLAVLIVTIRVNVPLNDGIKAAGDPASIADPSGVRKRFDEGRWTRANLVRSLASTAGFVCLAWALVLFGRLGA